MNAPPTPVWISRYSVPVWLIYSTNWNQPDTTRLDWFARQRWADLHGEPGPDPIFRGGRFGLEMVGATSGLKVSVEGAAGSTDPEWAPHEASRIVGHGQRGIWVLQFHYRELEISALRSALARLVEEIDVMGVGTRVNLWRVMSTAGSD